MTTSAAPSDVRTWARSQGLTKAERGPLPRSVLDAYAAAHTDAAAARRSTATATRPAAGTTGPAPTSESLAQRLRVVEDKLADALSRLAAVEANAPRSLLGLHITL